MYANLHVRVTPKRDPDGRAVEVLDAYHVNIIDGEAIVHLDANDGGSHGIYPEPAGERRIDLETHNLDIHPTY